MWYNIPNHRKVNTYYRVAYYQYTASNISYHLTKASLTDSIEEIHSVADTEAAEASNIDTTKSGLVQDDDNYTGLN